MKISGVPKNNLHSSLDKIIQNNNSIYNSYKYSITKVEDENVANFSALSPSFDPENSHDENITSSYYTKASLPSPSSSLVSSYRRTGSSFGTASGSSRYGTLSSSCSGGGSVACDFSPLVRANSDTPGFTNPLSPRTNPRATRVALINPTTSNSNFTIPMPHSVLKTTMPINSAIPVQSCLNPKQPATKYTLPIELSTQYYNSSTKDNQLVIVDGICDDNVNQSKINNIKKNDTSLSVQLKQNYKILSSQLITDTSTMPKSITKTPSVRSNSIVN